MTLHGAYAKITGVPWLAPDAEFKSLPEYERLVEDAVLAKHPILINCAHMDRYQLEGSIVNRAGAVPLRWGAPRILLVRPDQHRLLESGVELDRGWRLWRYKFDPQSDAWVAGSPTRALKLIRANIEAGRPWQTGLPTE